METSQEPGPPRTIRSFVRGTRDAIVADWRATIGSPQFGAPATLAERAPELLDHIVTLAEQVERGDSLQRTFERARESTFVSAAEALDVSTRVAELAALRGCITALWQRASPARDAELRALDVAIDAVIAAVVWRHQEAQRAQLERVASDWERAFGKLESLLAASPVGIGFVDLDLRYLRINDALAALNGRPAAEHLGRSIAEMLPEASSVLEPIVREVLATGVPVINRQLPVPSHADPHALRTLLATYFPVRSPSGPIVGVGAVVSDVSETRRAAEALRREQERMQSIIEHTPASVWVKDAGGRIVLANHRLAAALGHPYENLIGRRTQDLLPGEFSAQHEAHDEIVLREHRAIEAEESVPGPDGPRTFLSIKFPLPGDPPMVGGIATEITERKRMEEQLRVAIAARERMLAVVSHDLRSPVGTIQLAAATLLGRAGADSYSRRFIEMIQRSCLRMEHLIQDLLDMASLGAGALSVELQPELAGDLLREAFELHQPLADEKAIRLVRRCDAEGVRVACDRQRIMQVFANLIGNALKFCRAGETVTLACERAEGAVCFSVEDTGPGIDPALLTHLFDPFRSGPGTRGGVGLGLYIARGIVERHAGHMEVESTVGRGTRFSFTLPIAKPQGPVTAG